MRLLRQRCLCLTPSLILGGLGCRTEVERANMGKAVREERDHKFDQAIHKSDKLLMRHRVEHLRKRYSRRLFCSMHTIKTPKEKKTSLSAHNRFKK